VGGLNLNPAQVGSLTNRPDFRARLARLPPELQERALSRLWTLTVRPKLSKGLADSEVEQSKQQFIRGVLRQAMPAPLERGQAPAPSAAMPKPSIIDPLSAGYAKGISSMTTLASGLTPPGGRFGGVLQPPGYTEEEAARSKGALAQAAEEYLKRGEATIQKSEEYQKAHPIVGGLAEIVGQAAPSAPMAALVPGAQALKGFPVLSRAASALPRAMVEATSFAKTPQELVETGTGFAVAGGVLGAVGERIPALRRLVRRILGRPLEEMPSPAAAAPKAATPAAAVSPTAGAAPAAAGAPPAPIDRTLLQDFEAMAQRKYGRPLDKLTDVEEKDVHRLVVEGHGKIASEARAARRAERKADRTAVEAAKVTEKDTKVASRLTAAELRAKANKEVGAYKKAVPAGARNLEALENLAKGNITAQEAIGKYHATQQATTASTTEAVAQATAENPQLAKAAEAAQTVRQAVAPSAEVTRMTYDDAAVLIRSDEVIRNAVAEHMKLNPGKKAPQALRDVLRDRGMNVELAAAAPKARVAKAAAPPRSVAEIDSELVGLEQEAGAGRVSAEDYIDRKRKLLIEKAKATGETEVAKKLRQEQAAEGIAGKRKAALRTEALTQQEAQLGGGKRTKAEPPD